MLAAGDIAKKNKSIASFRSKDSRFKAPVNHKVLPALSLTVLRYLFLALVIDMQPYMNPLFFGATHSSLSSAYLQVTYPNYDTLINLLGHQLVCDCIEISPFSITFLCDLQVPGPGAYDASNGSINEHTK